MFKTKVRININELNKYIKDAIKKMRLDIKRNQNEIRSLRSKIHTLNKKIKGE